MGLEDSIKTKDYSDIIDLPHHVSKTRKRMSMDARAAQFSPFAALTGYDEEIDEAARLTDDRLDISFDDAKREDLDRNIGYLEEHASENITIKVEYFVPDERKEGGEYRTVQGVFKRIDISDGILCFKDGLRIKLNEIYGIDIIS